MKQLKVYIINSSWDYEHMWASRGHLVVSSLEQADLVQFTGGSDVSPHLYGEKNVRSHCDASRDIYEQKIFEQCRALGKPMVGICRGGQFLNVMNGGKMWQHVDGHIIPHNITDQLTNDVYKCTSTHHQMMRPNTGAKVVGLSSVRISNSFENALGVFADGDFYDGDCEVLYYPTTKSLCFQPHPEFGAGECQDYYFILIERYYGGL